MDWYDIEVLFFFLQVAGTLASHSGERKLEIRPKNYNKAIQ
jgi:hypothetical protein